MLQKNITISVINAVYYSLNSITNRAIGCLLLYLYFNIIGLIKLKLHRSLSILLLITFFHISAHMYLNSF